MNFSEMNLEKLIEKKVEFWNNGSVIKLSIMKKNIKV